MESIPWVRCASGNVLNEGFPKKLGGGDFFICPLIHSIWEWLTSGMSLVCTQSIGFPTYCLAEEDWLDTLATSLLLLLLCIFCCVYLCMHALRCANIQLIFDDNIGELQWSFSYFNVLSWFCVSIDCYLDLLVIPYLSKLIEMSTNTDQPDQPTWLWQEGRRRGKQAQWVCSATCNHNFFASIIFFLPA